MRNVKIEIVKKIEEKIDNMPRLVAQSEKREHYEFLNRFKL